ncbi:HNH endonuclease [Streptomyces rishiriensis]|uniref:HNH endonuclease n=1 Tax=Streptomyces rishiriensis TaxID=68264 RepID=UPI0037AA6014
MGEVLRSAQNRDPTVPIIDGHPNIHYVTASQKLAQVQLSKGINPIAKTKTPHGRRRPGILIRSSPWKAGSAETPWRDVFDLDQGLVRYFGDHRVDHTVPAGCTPGNAVLLEAFAEHQASNAEKRALAVPLLVFASVGRNKTPKGYVEFCGVAVIERVEQVEQETQGIPFPNYRYDLTILDLSSEGDKVDWAWIEARGDSNLSAFDALAHAPRSWRQWVEHGNATLPSLRRQTVRPEGKASRLPSTENGHKTPGILPMPQGQNGTTSGRASHFGHSETLNVSTLMNRLRNLRSHERDGHLSKRRSLALLWSISRIATGAPRLTLWPQFHDEMGGLLAELDFRDSLVNPENEFLQGSQLWDVHDVSLEHAVKAEIAPLDGLNPTVGITEQAEHLLKDPFVRSQAVAVLRETYLSDVDSRPLLKRLGLTGYENASGVMDDPIEQAEESGPASRRPVTESRIVRDPKLTAEVKELYSDSCQVCGLQLPTRFSTYSEAAHIRGLGRPHNGPDKLSNLLVLCPNHHVQFDALAIYIDTGGIVRMTVDDRPIDVLRQHPDHHINDAHLRYHRALCGRDYD